MTQPTKGAVGLKGYPTPDNPEDMQAYLLFYFPDRTWAQYILGACKNLQYPYNWYKSGEMSVDDAAEAFRIIVQDAPYNLLDPTVPTPFWDEDSGDDADDEQPKETQPWYGQLQIIDDELTFVENAFIWVVAGIIVYAGLPLAAIQFVPLAQKFVVTVKKNPLGGIIRFLADSVEIGRVDTYSATDVATEVPVMMPASMGFVALDAPVLWIELLEDNPHGLESISMTVMRSRLSEADFSPTSLRYNSDCDCVQYSPDGGETWVDDPGDDPRTAAKFIKPLKTGSDVACRSAASMVKWMRDFIEYERDLLVAGAEITAVANAALSLFDILAPWAVLIQLLVDLAGTLFGIGGGALAAAFGDDEWDALLCIFYCGISADASITETQFADIQDAITDQLNTTAALVLNLIISTQGIVGLQNAGTLYEVGGADCSGCECGWCFQWTGSELSDFTVVQGSFVGTGIDATNYYDSGSDQTYRYLDASISVPAGAHVFFVSMTYEIHQGTFLAANTDTIYKNTRATNIAVRTSGGDGFVTLTYEGAEITDMLTAGFVVVCGQNAGAIGSGSAHLYNVTMKGTDDINPFGADNC